MGTRIPVDIPPGLIGDDTTHAAAGRYASCSGIRWTEGRAEIRGGCEKIVDTLLTGVCRTVFNWSDKLSALNISFGTNSSLQVCYDGLLSDVTPTKALPPTLLGTNPLGVANTSAVVTVTHQGHGFATADSVTISGAAAIGGITPNGTFAVTVIDADRYSYIFTSSATSTVAAGGGAAVLITPQKAYAAGAVDGTGGQGYGTGAYSVGTYSAPSTVDFYPRTWSLDQWGENLMANPRGLPIYAWTNNVATPAAPLLNSPARVSFMLVSPTDQVFAFGCNEEVSGVFNAVCIRHSGIRDNTQWNTASDTTAREYILPGGGRIVAARVIGNNILVWTDFSLFLGVYVGSPGQPWRFDKVADKCGLIGPNAAVVVNSRAYWLGPDLQFYAYTLGASVSPVDCPIRKHSVVYMAASQGDKVVASSTSSFREIRFDYPDSRDGNECSRYVTLIISNPDAGAWAQGEGAWARTSYVDAGPSQFPISTDITGRALWQERGMSDDGGALSGFLETADQYLDETRTSLVQAVWPDMSNQVGPITLTIISRLKPQAAEVSTDPVAMAPGQGKADIRANGRLHRLRYDFNSAPASCRWGKPLFDITLGGYR